MIDFMGFLYDRFRNRKSSLENYVKSTLDPLTLAKRFADVGHLFIKMSEDKVTTVDFEAPGVMENACGTVACHGGFALLALCPVADAPEYFRPYPYYAGATILAEYLGFTSKEAYEMWASNNPELWGNEHGALMFTGDGDLSFCALRGFHIVNLRQIGHWYLGVSRRIAQAS